MTNDYDVDSKGTRLVVTKRNHTSGDLSLIDSYGVWRVRTCGFRDEIFPRERITFKRAPVRQDELRRRCPPRAVSRGKAAIRLVFLTVSDGC